MADKSVETADGPQGSDRVADDVKLHRYNAQLPQSYRASLSTEQKLLRKALIVLGESIASSSPTKASNFCQTDMEVDEEPEDALMGETSDNEDSKEEHVSEAYQHELERDAAALEKGISRYLDLKHSFQPSDLPFFFSILLRAALTPSLDIGLRSKLARCAGNILSIRQCVLPDGVPWRLIVDRIVAVHIDSVDGAAYVGKDVRESHCRNFLILLSRTRYHLSKVNDARDIWNHFWPEMSATDPDVQFRAVMLMASMLPTMGSAWSGWTSDAMALWGRLESSSDWDSIWMTLISRVSRNQPCLHDWTPYYPRIYTRLEAACSLPLGALPPQGSIDRRCPHHLNFLMDFSMISSAARLLAYSLSPRYPEALNFLQRFFALITNYFHPSNSGRWSTCLSNFLVNFTSGLENRVTSERQATAAGRSDRVIGTADVTAVAPAEHRLDEETIEKVIKMLIPVTELGLYSKVSIMTVQSASAIRDLAIINPDIILPSMLAKTSEDLVAISNPHRTSAALRLLATLTPVFLDPAIFPSGIEYLPQALILTLPGIDPNDLGKTEATFKFIAGAASRIQGLSSDERMVLSEDFLDDYMRQFLESIFSLLDTLEAPPKKPGGAHPLSFFLFSTTAESLFTAVPKKVVLNAAKKVAAQLTSAACLNALKFYSALARVAASAAAVVSGGSSVNIFIPQLLNRVLEGPKQAGGDADYSLVSLSEDELVWRIRLLAQACRCVGSGLEQYLDKISTVVRLSFENPTRSIYKSGGRLLRGVLEGLTAIQMKYDVYGDEGIENSNDVESYNFDWRIPEEKDWRAAESFLVGLVEHAEKLCPFQENLSSDFLAAKRDLLFRVLRLLHASQRGGRWLLAGALPDHFHALDKFKNDSEEMSKREAKLILKRPVPAGLGGERDAVSGRKFAVDIWTRIYGLALTIIKAVMKYRPDDGALLYRCLEPLELANEPFRHGSQSRQVLYAAGFYKHGYLSVMSTKRPFGAVGGPGRAMPRFIFKLRIEAQHEFRLSAAARGGLCAPKTCEEILHHLTGLSLNDFPRVRAEARGVMVRTLKVVKPHVRRVEIGRIIDVLRNAGNEDDAGSKTTSSNKNIAKDENPKVSEEASPSSKQRKFSKDDGIYEKIIGASSILRSTAAAPLIVRDALLMSQIIHALISAALKAERPDTVSAVFGLFGKIAYHFRPLGIDPIRLLGSDFKSAPQTGHSPTESAGQSLRLKSFNDLNNFLLNVVEVEAKHGGPKLSNGVSSESDRSFNPKEAHWIVQTLIATILFMLIRADRPPSARVARFFIQGVISDVVTFRGICFRALALILSLHGRRPHVAHNTQDSFDDSPASWGAAGNAALSTIGDVVCTPEFAANLIKTMALDYDEDSGDGFHRGGHGMSKALNYSSVSDGESCWQQTAGHPWPTSWTPRSRDSLNVVRVRMYESLVRVYGKAMVDVLIPRALDMITKLEKKQDTIISGVNDDDVRVISAELLAGIGRGLDVYHDHDRKTQSQLFELTKALLTDMSGAMGNVNGATLIRFLGTADVFTIGPGVMKKVLEWQIDSKPIVASLGDGPMAHTLSRKLRYIHSCIADIDNSEDEKMKLAVQVAIDELTNEISFNHELKTVREEVGRLLSLVAVNVSPSKEQGFENAMLSVRERLESLEAVVLHDNGVTGSNEMTASKAVDNEADGKRKNRSRQCETLARFVSIVYWNGRAYGFERFLPIILPSVFRCIDESDPERISHARMALSLIAQGAFRAETVDKIMTVIEKTALDPRWNVRASVLGFVQIFSFCHLFTASEEVLARIRDIVLKLLSDSQLEVRQAAATSFVTIIRDSVPAVIDGVRNHCMQVLKDTTVRRRAGKRTTLDGERLFQRHGAVLALSSMVTSSPYSVPEWMPSVLVALSGCINDQPPISTGVRDLFGDFMRTHRDEWQTHKQAFTTDELEIVSELLVSPSYYA